ncbi:MAG: DUF819 family protein [Flavobacteriaceae bacterium]|nr:DUF819 family protein [Flavobacteriaceae bacterium]
MTPWIITGVTVLSVYFLSRWDNKYLQKVLDWIPAILFAYLIPAGVSYLLKKDFSNSDIHEYSKLYFIPLAIVAVMSSLSMTQLKAIGWKPILVFFSGSLWIALFPILFTFLFFDTHLVKDIFIDEGYWKGIPPIVGSWIGGSTSQLVLKEAVKCPENIFLTVLVLDNILVNIWTILMFQGIKKSNWLNRFLRITDADIPKHIELKKEKALNAVFCFIVLLITVIITNAFIHDFVIKVILLSLIGLVFSNFIKNWNFTFVLKLGSVLILIVMAVLGLKLKFHLFKFDLDFLTFLIVWLVSHFYIMLFIAKLLNVNSAWVPIASMANVGGIATAPAVTSAYEKSWMPHAIIMAILSMATGTFWGILTIYLFENILF